MVTFTELDDTTRAYMLRLFETERDAGDLYPSKRMTAAGSEGTAAGADAAGVAYDAR
jgi:hypothetical protein